ncbi:MAG: hypothetical protein ACR2QO_03290 [Acidimicrobiales bacterium]
MHRLAPKTAIADSRQIHVRIDHVRAKQEGTSIALAWATAIVAFIMLVVLAIL